jgi:hypothetical protein
MWYGLRDCIDSRGRLLGTLYWHRLASDCGINKQGLTWRYQHTATCWEPLVTVTAINLCTVSGFVSSHSTHELLCHRRQAH